MGAQELLQVSVRLPAAGLADIDRMAEAEERDRSAMIRILLREAMARRQQLEAGK